MKQRSLLAAILLIACMCTGAALPAPSFAQKTPVPNRPDRVAIASEKVTELFALMDTDKNGKISKQAWMKFMESQFDRLDTNKTGEINPNELLQSTVVAKHIRTLDLGK
jgi:hypothetical protein